MELIEKSAVVAEIERLSAYLDSLHEQRIIEKILSIIDTLEVKEVDFDGEIDKWICDAAITHEDCSVTDVISTAKYFFELGLKVNCPITASDRGMAEEIITNLKRVEKDYLIDLTKEIEWLRNKIKKEDKL